MNKTFMAALLFSTSLSTFAVHATVEKNAADATKDAVAAVDTKDADIGNTGIELVADKEADPKKAEAAKDTKNKKAKTPEVKKDDDAYEDAMGEDVHTHGDPRDGVPARSFKEAIENALDANPLIGADQEALEASDHDIRAARSDYFPSLDLNASGGYGYNRKHYKQGALSSPLKGHTNRFIDREDARLSQIIFNGFETQSTVDRAKNLREQAHFTLHGTQEGVAFDATAAYIDLRARQRLFDLAEDNVKTHERILDKVKGRVQGGLGTVADTHQVEARLQDALVARDQLQGELDVAIARYIEIVGEEPGLLNKPKLPKSALKDSLDDAIHATLHDNPKVRIAEKRVKVAESDLEIAKAPWYPTFRAEVDTGRQHNQSGVKGDEYATTAQLVGELNLYRGGKDTARKKSQRHKLAEAKYRLASERRVAERTVRKYWADMISAESKAKELRLASDINNQLRHDYFTQFDLGDRGLLDVLDAEVAFFRSRSSLITADADHDISTAGVISSYGMLVSALTDSDVGMECDGDDAHSVKPHTYATVEKGEQQGFEHTHDGMTHVHELGTGEHIGEIMPLNHDHRHDEVMEPTREVVDEVISEFKANKKAGMHKTMKAEGGLETRDGITKVGMRDESVGTDQSQYLTTYTEE